MNPRLLTKAQAAAYCGYSQNRFGELVREGLHRWILNMQAGRCNTPFEFQHFIEEYIRTFGVEAAA